MKKAKQLLEELYTVYNPQEEQEEGLNPENRSKFDSKQLRNIMLGTLSTMGKENIVEALIEVLNKMSDSWVIEFLETINGDVVEPISESLKSKRFVEQDTNKE